jgi:uncharacterized protein YhaN
LNASLEQHLASGGRPLPFIADDLFINFDDKRAAAAFGVLAELAQRTQVIYLTHHPGDWLMRFSIDGHAFGDWEGGRTEAQSRMLM